MYSSKDPKSIEIPDEQFSLYKELFAQGSFGVPGGFLIQPKGGDWYNPKRIIHDKDITDHLQQKISIATIPPYYPSFFTIDLDFPPVLFGTHHDNTEERVSKIIDVFQLHDSEFLQFTSPSFGESRDQHIYVPVIYNGKPASSRLIKTILEFSAFKGGVELFPCGRKPLRLPLGYKQALIDKETGAPLSYSWTESLEWLSKLEPVDLSDRVRFPFQQYRVTEAINEIDINTNHIDAQYYWEQGLQAFGTRHDVTGQLARSAYFRNWDQDISKDAIKNWLRLKHNGYSMEVRKGNWREVDNDIDRWVEDTYEYYGNKGIYPTAAHNSLGWLTKEDVGIVLSFFYGDFINQKRFSHLIQHFRGRTNGDRRWIPMSRNAWRTIIGSRYIELMRALEGKILNVRNSYWPGLFSKGIFLDVPHASPSQMLIDKDNRAIQDWKNILLSIYGNIESAAQASGIHKRRFYEGLTK